MTLLANILLIEQLVVELASHTDILVYIHIMVKCTFIIIQFQIIDLLFFLLV